MKLTKRERKEADNQMRRKRKKMTMRAAKRPRNTPMVEMTLLRRVTMASSTRSPTQMMKRGRSVKL